MPNISQWMLRRSRPRRLFEKALAEVALGEAVDGLAGPFGAAADGDHQHLDVMGDARQ